MARVLIPLPDHDFDVTEVATPWHRLSEAGHEVVFATERGAIAAADPLLIRGVIFGQLGAKPDALARYGRMLETAAFRQPLTYEAIEPAAFDALVLPGGHAQGMKPYLESELLRTKVLGFFHAGKPVAAICHGVIVLARTIDPATGRSVLHGRRTTALLKVLERTGYYLTAWRLGRYYRTYPAYVEDEVTAALASPADFEAGRAPWTPFVQQDGDLITARWPLDAEAFAAQLVETLARKGRGPASQGR